MFIPFFVRLGPPRFRRFLLEMSPSPNLKMVKETVDIMAETSDAIFKDKLHALQQGDEFVSHQVAEGKDVMSILCTLTFIKTLFRTNIVHALMYSEGEYCGLK